MAFEYGDMLQTIKDRQWALADIDWDAPGAELITDEQRPSLKQFMSDVVWIEHVGARAFAAMAPRRRSTRWVRFTGISTPKSSGTPTWSSLSCIAGDARGGRDSGAEQEHPAGHRMAGPIRRSTSVDGDRCCHTGFRNRSGRSTVEVFGGRGVRSVCGEVFAKVSSDESRHLAVGFQVLNDLGASPMRIHAIQTVGALIDPRYLPVRCFTSRC